MTYLVNDKCIKCKHTTCVDVCPVDCFYEGKNMLVIKPDECIDCGVCEPECPVDAIISDTEDESGRWLEINKKYSELWPNITDKKEVKVVPEMLNLLGCTKENFKKLLKKMDYKIYEKEKEFFIKYLPAKRKISKRQDKKDYSNNPFNVLHQLNLK